MPILYFLKDPPLTLASEGQLDEGTIKKLLKSTPMIRGKAGDGGPLLITINQDVNIAYIKEITQENLDKMRDEAKELAEGKRIHPAAPGVAFPGKRGRGGRPS